MNNWIVSTSDFEKEGIEYKKFILFPLSKMQCRFEYTRRLIGSIYNPRDQKSLFIQIGSALGKVLWQKKFVWYIT